VTATATAIESATAATDSATATAGRLRRRLALVISVAAMLTGLVFTGSSAEAAGTSAPDIHFCFSYADGSAYANGPVTLNYSGGTVVRSGRTNASGCGTWTDVTGNRTYSIQAKSVATTWYGTFTTQYTTVGTTPLYNIGNLNTTYEFGRWTVTTYRTM